MKPVPSRSLTLPVLTCAFLLPMVVGSMACGDEAALPPGGTGATTTTGGQSVVPTGGSAGSAVTTTGGMSGGSATTAGTNGNPTAGTPAAGGTGPTAGTGPEAGTGPAAGTSSGGSTPMGGSAPMGGTAAGGSAGDLKETVAGPINGAMWTGPCLTDSSKTVCQTAPGACPPKNANDPAVGGQLTTDKTIKLGGDPAKTYTITLHVQGEVEAKGYINGMDQNNQAAHPKMDGFYTGGVPESGNDYNVYMARVSDPKQDYFFNSVKPPGVTDHTTYLLDYTAKIKAKGGASVRLTAADTNCSMIKNCGPTPNGTTLCAQPLIMTGVDPIAMSKNPTFDFTKAYNGQWLVMVVTDVTAD